MSLYMPRGFVYVMAIMDVFSRKVIAWDVGNSMDLNFCLPILEKALKSNRPRNRIFLKSLNYVMLTVPTPYGNRHDQTLHKVRKTDFH